MLDDLMRDCHLEYWTRSLPTADVFNGGCIILLVKKLARSDLWKESKQAINRVILATALTFTFPAFRSAETLDLMTCLESISLKYL